MSVCVVAAYLETREIVKQKTLIFYCHPQKHITFAIIKWSNKSVMGNLNDRRQCSIHPRRWGLNTFGSGGLTYGSLLLPKLH